MFRQRQGNLQEAAGRDKIVGAVRSQRIAPPGGARDVATALAQQRVIQQCHAGAGRWEGVRQAAERNRPQGLAVQTLALEQTIRGRPVAELLPGSAQQARQRGPPQTGQDGKAQRARPLAGALLRESRKRLIEQGVPSSHHTLPRLFFLAPWRDLGDSRGEIDVPPLTALALDWLHFCRKSHKILV